MRHSPPCCMSTSTRTHTYTDQCVPFVCQCRVEQCSPADGPWHSHFCHLSCVVSVGLSSVRLHFALVTFAPAEASGDSAKQSEGAGTATSRKGHASSNTGNNFRTTSNASPSNSGNSRTSSKTGTSGKTGTSETGNSRTSGNTLHQSSCHTRALHRATLALASSQATLASSCNRSSTNINCSKQ